MTYLSFKLNKAEIDKELRRKPFLKMEVRDLKVYWKEEELIENIGSFGQIDTPVNCVKIITTEICDINQLLFQIGFKIDPNFTFKINIDKSPEWLCSARRCVENNIGLRNGLDNVYENWLDFDYYNKDFKIIDHPLFDEKIEEVNEIKKILISNINQRGIDNLEKVNYIIQIIENSQSFKYYKQKLNDQQLIDFQEKLRKLEEEFEIEREGFLDALKNSQEWHERDLEAKVEERLKLKLSEMKLNKEEFSTAIIEN
ncbi:MAG: hypothetical protein AD073_000273 [Mycoplasmataceae bacterium]|nr:MAG: hypothetical protein AD073_000273 [Mycoplasmataceae bacterium]